jgi:hypothetical protein
VDAFDEFKAVRREESHIDIFRFDDRFEGRFDFISQIPWHDHKSDGDRTENDDRETYWVHVI